MTDDTLQQQKMITVYDMNRFLMLVDIPLQCAVCGRKALQIPAASEEEGGIVYEHRLAVTNLPEGSDMTYLTTVCGHCGYMHWFWKEQVVNLLESKPLGDAIDE